MKKEKNLWDWGSKYIWMNGELVEYEKATVHLLTPVLHYGAAVFEGIRSYNTDKGPAVFRLWITSSACWILRMYSGCEMPFTVDQVVQAVKDTVHANGFTDCYIRPFLDHGCPPNLNVDAGKPALAIATWEWNNYLGEKALAKGIRANIASYTRHHPNVSMTKAKISGNYVNSFLAKTKAERLEFRKPSCWIRRDTLQNAPVEFVCRPARQVDHYFYGPRLGRHHQYDRHHCQGPGLCRN